MSFINLKESLGTRLVIIAFLTLVMLIPSFIVQDLIRERENRRDAVTAEISDKWGGEQSITGPLLSIPYKHYYNNDNKVEATIRYAHFLPENLSIDGSILTEERYRGIYEVIVYNGKIKISGNFSPLNLEEFNIPVQDFLIEDAFVSVGISDMTGIKNFVNISWNGKEYPANPGIETSDVLESGISISPGILVEADKEYRFNFELDLNGSSGILFAPVGKETIVKLSSVWPNPSFRGAYLPENREVSSSGFSSNWKVLHLNRNFPQQWLGANREVSASSFGVDFLLPVDEYRQTMRTAKYAIMFISLTFLTFFMFELLGNKIIHPVQYLLVGFGLLIFYTLLLSLSEYLLFNVAYLIASAAIISLITIYSYSIIADKLKSIVIFGVLVFLYSYLFILLQLQDYALLLGSIGLFMILSIVMFLTRNINWFEILSSQKLNDHNSEHVSGQTSGT
ncbi:MAG: cell envelope integrity protein CreD [Candidatus Halalkalibacterium sp. M3_1C_030]